MLTSETLITIGVSVFSVTLTSILLYLLYRKRSRITSTGYKSVGRTAGADKATAAMRSFAARNSFRFIEPATIEKNGKKAEFSGMVVGYFGVLAVIPLGYNGEVYGDPGQDDWVQVVSGKRTSFTSPVLEASAAVRVLRDVMIGAGLRKVPVEVVTVFTNNSVLLAVPRSVPQMKMKEFKALLKKDKYLEDTGLDLDKVEAAVRAAVAE